MMKSREEIVKMWNDGGRDEDTFYPIVITLLMDIRDAVVKMNAPTPSSIAVGAFGPPDTKPEEKPAYML